ncbi:hypothetical protein K449DRAFT_429316 [Hypoxylon sp. EC38]|nr:hypothetical protein K449DRAFT_429316 [Hypoxylon sp. EC38]
MRLELAGVEGIGFHGGSLIFAERDNNGNVVRNLNIKYAADTLGLARIDTEAVCLVNLRGASHFQQIISLPETTVNVAGTGNKYPIIALEYLQFGSLALLRERVSTEGFYIPSKVLWLVFRCMARQILGMMTPPSFSAEDEVIQEEPVPWIFYAITHGQAHGRYHKFGGISAEDDDEHDLLPILKLTDFSRGIRQEIAEIRIEDEEVVAEAQKEACDANLRAAAQVMEWLACTQEDEAVFETLGTVNEMEITDTQGGEVYDEDGHPVIETTARRVFLEDENIDLALRELVARCLATKDENVPTHEELLALCDDGARNRDPLSTSIFPEERIFDIDPRMNRLFVQRYLFDADTHSEGIISRSDLANMWRLEYRSV